MVRYRGYQIVGCLCLLAGVIGQLGPSARLADAASRERWDVGPVPKSLLPVVVENPTTPPTLALSAEEANDVLELDWLFQADGCPTVGRAQREIEWARQLAERLVDKRPALDLSAEFSELDRLQRRCVSARPQRNERRRTLPEGLRACWTFDDVKDGVFTDTSNQAREGKLIGKGELAPGVFGESLLLGGRAFVNAGQGLSSIAAGNHTLTAWIKTRMPTGDFMCSGIGRGCVLLQTYRGVAKGHHWTTTSGNVLPGKTQVCDGRWHHVAQVVDDDSISVYVDGRLDAKMALEGKKVAVKGPMLIGSRSTTSLSWRYRGRLDDVCFFGRALTAADLERMFDDGKEAVGEVDADAWELYVAVRCVKRRIAFKNPLLDFDRVVFIDQPYPRGLAWPHQAIHRLGHRAVPGGRLLLLEGLHPGGAVRKLYPEKPGSFWRPEVSFDGERLLFCYKAHDEKSFHLYEINLDGSGLRQLTFGDYDDVDPICMPDGRIVFTTTRGNTYVRCGPFIYSYVLARCDADGSNLYLISTNSEPDFVPALMHDGRVIYSRWEYTDKALWRVQSLWTTNPDGTNTSVLWGNQSVWPDHLAEPRPIPGSRRIMFTGVGHHNWFSGSIGIIDPAKGLNFPEGLTKVTADLRWPECSIPPLDPAESGQYHSSGVYTGYLGAYPLSEEYFLVSARGEGGKFRLYLMDVYGNRELIYEGVHHVWYGVPVRPREKPPVYPDSTVWPGTSERRKPNESGLLYSVDVYDGVPDLPRGSVRYLRVIQQDAKTYSSWKKTFRHSGPPVSVIQEEAVKRIVSTVPIEPDGSVYFKVPAGESLYFQLLDERYRALQTMRSFAGVMPGERRGCLGCHEMHSAAPPKDRAALALKRPPAGLSPPPWGTESISFERFAQPVFDRYCGKCHQGEGKGRKKLDLTLRGGHGPFKQPYLTLVGPAGWGNPAKPGPGYGIAGAIPVESRGTYRTLKPKTYLSYKSKLIEIASSGKHNKVKVDPVSLRRLIAWVDACCPFRGGREVRAFGDPYFPGIERLPIRPRVATAPVVVRP